MGGGGKQTRREGQWELKVKRGKGKKQTRQIHFKFGYADNTEIAAEIHSVA